MRIKPLDPECSSLISSSYSIFSLSFVIRELIENSVDASASEISVILLDGGLDKIIITDNGTGIPDLSLIGNGKFT